MLELTHNKRLDVDWTIPTIPLFHKNKQACSLQIIWNDVAGGFDGQITIYISNANDAFYNAKTIEVNGVDNINDSELFILDLPFNYMKIEYTANNNTAGKLTALLKYH